MKNGSHQRSSYPFDKPLPQRIVYWDEPWGTVEKSGSPFYTKRMHRKKQRQHNRKLEKEAEHG